MNYYNSSGRKTRAFVSFDYDNDLELKHLLIGQSKHEDTPFEIIDMSVKQELAGDWKEKARQKIKNVDHVIVICGERTHSANGVSAEIRIAQEEGIPYFLIQGRASGRCVKPVAALETDKIYNWTWDNLKLLLNGRR